MSLTLWVALIFQQEPSQVFTPQNFEDQVLRFIIASRLPFNTVEHVQFKRLLKMIGGPRLIRVPTRHDVKNRLMELSKNTHMELLSKLPASGKISLAMDCWTSTTRHAFLATTGYFIDDAWNYHEILVGFDPLSGSHEGRNLANTVIQTLNETNLSRRVLSITTDNAGNNGTMMRSLVKILQEELNDRQTISSEALDPVLRNLLSNEYHMPCMAHVIQLIAKAFLTTLRLEAKNDTVERTWDNETDAVFTSNGGIAHALEKVCHSSNLT